MILKKLYISSFGKLKDYELNFNQGLNPILHENGWGKSTLAVFIKCMFYGIDDTKKKLEENEKKLYRPWGSEGTFGGYIEFETKGKNYRIERYFGSKQGEESVKLFDCDSGKEYSKVENLGSRLFGIDQEGFLSTCYFSQDDITSVANASITNKFNTSSNEKDFQVFNFVLEKMENEGKDLSYLQGKRGIIADTKEKIRNLKSEEIDQINSQTTIDAINKEIEQLKAEINVIKEQLKSLSVLKEKCDRLEAYKERKERLEENNLILKSKLQELEGISKELNNNVVEEKEIEKVIGINQKNENLRQELNGLKDYVIKKGVSKKQTLNTNGIVFLILSSIFFLLSATFVFVLPLVAIISLVPFVLFLVLLILSVKKTDKTDEKNDNPLDKIKELENEIEKNNNYIQNFLSRFNVETDKGVFYSLEKIKADVNKLKDLSDEIRKLKTAVNDLNKSIAENPCEENINKEEVYKNYNDKNNLLMEKMNLISSKESSKVYQEQKASLINETREQIEYFEKQLKIYEKNNQTIINAKKFLLQADENLKKKYRAPLLESFNKYIKCIKGGVYKNADIDIDMNVFVEEKGEKKEIAYYSRGIKDLFEICKRFSLIDVLFNDEKPFIMLDDPFTNLDEENTKTAIETIKNLSEYYQIIYTYCHNSRGV